MIARTRFMGDVRPTGSDSSVTRRSENLGDASSCCRFKDRCLSVHRQLTTSAFVIYSCCATDTIYLLDRNGYLHLDKSSW